MKYCSVPVYIITSMSLFSWFWIFLSILLLLHHAIAARVRCKRSIATLLHYIVKHYFRFRCHSQALGLTEEEDMTFLWKFTTVMGGVYLFFIVERVMRMINSKREVRPLTIHRMRIQRTVVLRGKAVDNPQNGQRQSFLVGKAFENPENGHTERWGL